MSQTNRTESATVEWKGYVVFAVVLVSALVLRLYYFSQVPIERLDDSYTRWLMATLTLRNNLGYSDIRPMPNLSVVYLPLYQYLSAFAMALIGTASITVQRYISMLAGTATCVLVTFIARRIYNSDYLALLTGLFLAVQPWHIDFSVAGTDKALTGLLASLAFYYTLTSQERPAAITTALTALTSYEGWILVAAFVLPLAIFRRVKLRDLRWTMYALATVIVGWSIWGLLNTGNPLAWVTAYLNYSGRSPTFDSTALIFYPSVAFYMTTALIILAILLGLTNRNSRLIGLTLILTLAILSIGAALGVEESDLDRLVPLMPFMALSVVSGLPKPQGPAVRKVAIVALLLGLLVIPYWAQISIGPKKLFVISPEQRVASVLRDNYAEGMIVTDSATVIYFSQIDPSNILTYDDMLQFIKANGVDALHIWFSDNHVELLVWQNSSHSRASQILPQLGRLGNHNRDQIRIGNLLFVLIHEDSLEAGFWEHDPEFLGPPAIYVYRIEILR